MKVIPLIILWGLVAVIGCDSPVEKESTEPVEKAEVRGSDPESEAEISFEINRLMAEQEKAWSSGDLEAFMQHYWKNDSLVFVGKSGINRGWQTTLDNYHKSYPDKSAMGELTFENLSIQRLSSDRAFVIGKWHLTRDEGDLSGHYTLLWKMIDGSWKIVVDHSS